MLDKTQLEKLIMERFPGTFDPVGLKELITTIEHAEDVIKGNIEGYLTTGVEPELEVEGYSYADLRKNHGMTPLAALLTLNYLMKNPEKAKEALNKGHDFVGTKE